MKIAVIGAGAAGLNATRHIIANNFECVTFEQTGEIGGTWVYTDDIGTDKYGIPVHTSMYQDLRSNLPKEAFGFFDFPMPDSEISYLPQKDVLEYLHNYANNFNLLKYIKFYNRVMSVKPIENRRWEIKVIDVRSKEEMTYEFDAIMICNGHFFKPRYARLKGIEKFRGLQRHSHDYRKAEHFQNKQVVIIGAGPSGVDLALHISYAATKVLLSHHLNESIAAQFPENVIEKPDIEEVTETDVIFKDGSREKIDCIMYCTGYNYSFPFLTKECGIFIEDNYVQPLYKQSINIEYPTMAFIGLQSQVATFPLFDLQVRFFIEFIKNPTRFPSKTEMLEEKLKDENKRQEIGLPKHLYHSLKDFQESYFYDLVEIGQLKPFPPVLLKIYNDRTYRAETALRYYRGDVYTIIDDENYTVKRATECLF